MDVSPVTLEGRVVRLEPLQLEHAAALLAVTDAALLQYSPAPTDWSLPGFTAYIARLVQRPAGLAFLIRMRDDGAVAGVTTYLDIRAADRGLEIGSTWIGRAFQETQVNPESKYLLLRHAFETLGAVRVQLKTDSRNEQSRRAIAKLGAVYEGVLRQHMILTDGYIRDTVMFSIIAAEWPRVKTRLEARLGYVP